MPSILPIEPPLESAKVSRIGLIAGKGSLPLHVARNATALGVEVIPFMVGQNNWALQDICQQKGCRITPGLVRRTLEQLHRAEIRHVVFAGKVDKWILLKDPRLDDMAAMALKTVFRLNDDAVMLWIIDQLKQQGIEVLAQADFLNNLFLSSCLLTICTPKDADLLDAGYGFEVAKEMGRLDIGQTIVVHSRMILAVEAIEGTDECLKRAGQLSGKKGGVVVKVAKPNQDRRFDIPAVGLKTLQSMRKAGLHMLVTEAEQTLYLEAEEMINYANRHGQIILSSSHSELKSS